MLPGTQTDFEQEQPKSCDADIGGGGGDFSTTAIDPVLDSSEEETNFSDEDMSLYEEPQSPPQQ